MFKLELIDDKFELIIDELEIITFSAVARLVLTPNIACLLLNFDLISSINR